MSTKIYNAYLWSGSAPELMEFLKELRQKYIEVASEHLVKFQGSIEDARTQWKTKDQFFTISLYLQDRIHSNVNEPTNIEASAAVYFRGEKIAIQFFGLESFYLDRKRPLQEIIKNHPKLEECEYWNNVDTPEELTEEEWDARRDFWDFLNVPSEDGLIYEFSSRNTIWEICDNYRIKTR